MPPEIGFPTLTSDASLNQRLMIAAVFHFVHPVEKDSKKNHKLTQNSVSYSCQSNKFQDAAYIFSMNSPVKF